MKILYFVYFVKLFIKNDILHSSFNRLIVSYGSEVHSHLGQSIEEWTK